MANQKAKLKGSEINVLFSHGSVLTVKRNLTEKNPVAFISENAAGVTGFESNEITQPEFDWLNQVHPKDKKRVESFYKSVKAGGVPQSLEYRFKKKNGKYISLREDVNFSETKGDDAFFLSTILKVADTKSSDFKAIEQELRKRLDYQNALAKYSNMLIDSTDSGTVEKAMKLLLQTTDTDRVYIFTSRKKKGEILLSQIHEVCRKGVEPQIDNPELQNMSFNILPWVFGTVSANKVVNIPIRELPSPEKEFMQDQDIQSFLLLPIFIDEEWFGFLGFDSTRYEKLWDEHEVSILKTAAEIIGTYFKRKSVEASLLNQKNFTQQVLNSLPGVAVVLNRSLKVLQWNKMAEKLTGYSPSEIKGLSAFDFVAPEEHEEMEEALRRILKKESDGQELNLINKYGKKTPYFWRGNVISFKGESLFVVIGLDISAQKEMEDALLEEKRLAETLINSLPGIFYMLDKSGKYRRINQNFIKEFGYSEEELDNMTPTDFYDEKEIPLLVKTIEEVFEKGSADVELEPKTKSGKKIPYYLKAIRFDRNDESFIVGTGYSISEQKQREEELKASVREKQVLLQEIHHRVKNNLAVISGLLELQMNEHDDPEYRGLVQDSQRRIQTMAIIHEKLYQSERLSQISMLLYMNDLIEQIGNSFNISRRNIEIETSIADVELSINQAIPFALAMNEIISNSLEHAFKGRDKGKLIVNLSYEDGQIRTLIKDNGVGMPEENTEKKGGSLGMTLINALLTQVGAEWEIKVEDGVTYEITFPIGPIEVFTTAE